MTTSGVLSPVSLPVASEVVLRMTRSGTTLGLDPAALFCVMVMEGSRVLRAWKRLLGDTASISSDEMVRAAPV